MKDKEHQGQQANSNGRATERDIQNRLLAHTYVRRSAIQDATQSHSYFVPQCRGFRNMVGRPWRVDFYLWHPLKWPYGLLIESKYQERGGSVDEKLPFTVISLKATGIPARLLLQGTGARQEYIAWCHTQEDSLFEVWSWDAFVKTLNKGII